MTLVDSSPLDDIDMRADAETIAKILQALPIVQVKNDVVHAGDMEVRSENLPSGGQNAPEILLQPHSLFGRFGVYAW